MADLYKQLVEDHVVLTDLLNALESVFSHYDVNSRFEPDLGLILETLDYITNYPEKFHHPLEDSAFNYLLKRRMGDANIIRTIRKQHQDLEAETVELTKVFNAVANDCIVPMDQLKKRLRHYVDAQRHHLNVENIHIFPVLARLDDNAWWDIASGLAIENLTCLPNDPNRGLYIDMMEFIRTQTREVPQERPAQIA